MVLVFFLSVVVLLSNIAGVENAGHYRGLGLLTDEYNDVVNYPGNPDAGVVNAGSFETIQEAIDFARGNGFNVVQLEGKTYNINTSILLYSGMTLQGVSGRTFISMIGVNKPVIKHYGSIAGYTVIRDLTVTGDVTQSANTGIVLNDYYSTIDNVTVATVGGHGIEFSTEGASSTLIENKVINCVVRNAQDVSYYFGADDNVVLTDGSLLNCVSQGSGDNLAVVIGSGGGWLIDGLHVYNHHGTSIPVYIRGGYNTTLTNVYIEGFQAYAIQFGACQLNVNISNINIITTDENAVGIFAFDASSEFGFDCNVNIANVSVFNSSSDGLDIIAGMPYKMKIKAVNLNATGSRATNAVSLDMDDVVEIP